MKKKGWNKRVFVAILVIVMAAACFGCGHETGVGAEEKQEEQKPDGIYLYGETHSNEYIQKRERPYGNSVSGRKKDIYLTDRTYSLSV